MRGQPIRRLQANALPPTGLTRGFRAMSSWEVPRLRGHALRFWGTRLACI